MRIRELLKSMVGLTLLVVACSPKIFPEEKIKLRALGADLTTFSANFSVDLKDIDTEGYLATDRILYKKGNTFGYFIKNKWICPPDCMIERLLLRHFNYLNGKGSSELYLKIIDLYADFSENIPKVILTVRAELKKDSSRKIRIFHYEKKFNNSEEAVFKAFNEVTTKFLRDLNEWLKK